MRNTLDLAKEINSLGQILFCMAYPGSSLHFMAKSNKIKLPEDDGGPGWIGYSQHAGVFHFQLIIHQHKKC